MYIFFSLSFKEQMNTSTNKSMLLLMSGCKIKQSEYIKMKLEKRLKFHNSKVRSHWGQIWHLTCNHVCWTATMDSTIYRHQPDTYHMSTLWACSQQQTFSKDSKSSFGELWLWITVQNACQAPLHLPHSGIRIHFTVTDTFSHTAPHGSFKRNNFSFQKYQASSWWHQNVDHAETTEQMFSHLVTASTTNLKIMIK